MTYEDAWKQEFENVVKIKNEYFHAHESLMLRLCEVLHLDYVEATDEDVIQKVQEMADDSLADEKEQLKEDQHPDKMCGSCGGRLIWENNHYTHKGPMFERHGAWPVEEWEDE